MAERIVLEGKHARRCPRKPQAHGLLFCRQTKSSQCLGCFAFVVVAIECLLTTLYGHYPLRCKESIDNCEMDLFSDRWESKRETYHPASVTVDDSPREQRPWTNSIRDFVLTRSSFPSDEWRLCVPKKSFHYIPSGGQTSSKVTRQLIWRKKRQANMSESIIITPDATIKSARNLRCAVGFAD